MISSQNREAAGKESELELPVVGDHEDLARRRPERRPDLVLIKGTGVVSRCELPHAQNLDLYVSTCLNVEQF